MPRKKKTETVPVTETKVSTVAEAAVETVKETAETAEKPAQKKTRAAKKTAAAKTEKPVKAPAKEKKSVKASATKKTSPAKKTVEKAKTIKATSKKETVKIQFGGEEFDLSDIKSVVEADYNSKFSGRVKTVEIYFKPEEKAVYYVVNSDFSGKIEL